jgi:hypothetical protein
VVLATAEVTTSFGTGEGAEAVAEARTAVMISFGTGTRALALAEDGTATTVRLLDCCP